MKKIKKTKVIAVVGSYGKTSTKEFLTTILSEKFKVLKTKKNQNNEFSIAKCILEELRPEHEYFVCEIGAYKKGEVKRIAKIIKPHYAIITGINEQHFALFGSWDNLISAEGGKEVVEVLPEDGEVFLNGENKELKNLYKNLKIKKRIVALNNKDVDLWATNILVEREKISFFVSDRSEKNIFYELNLIGSQNIINVLLASCAAKEIARINLEESALFCRKIKQSQSGITLSRTSNGFFLLDATYSSNPDAVIAHLDYLKKWESKKIIIMPCLIELGQTAKDVHIKIGKKIKEVCDIAVITTLDFFKEIKQEAGEKAFFLEDPKTIFEKIMNFCQEEDIILIEGRVSQELLKLLKI